MKQQFTDENTGINYTLQGDYYLPDLALPEGTETAFIGIYGERHRRYLKGHQRALYVDLLTSGKLPVYLVDINDQASEHLALLMKQMADAEGVTEKLKAENQMEWVGRMNNIKARAEELVNGEVAYMVDNNNKTIFCLGMK